ncbi:MAG: N-acetylmuramoyl-L-alanine amidase [Parvularculaceae bacterium]
MVWRFWLSVVAVLASAFASSAARADDDARLKGVRFGWRSATETRIVADFDGRPRFEVAPSLVGERMSNDVVVLNMGSVADDATAAAGRGYVAGAKLFEATPGARIAVALKKPAKVREAFVIPPSAATPHHRLVIDVVDATRAEFAAIARANRPTAPPAAKTDAIAEVIEESLKADPPAREADAKPKPDPVQTPARARAAKVAEAAERQAAADAAPAAPTRKPKAAGRRVIVVDAGHGGADPGAVGAAGAVEKTITLAAAKALEAALKKSGGYDVVLTRSDDRRLAYQERTRIARDAKADLFISLHADSLDRASVRGASVYTLSEAGSARSARQAQSQGDYVVFDLNIGEEDPDVGGILFDLAQRRTGTESERFAEILIDRLGEAAPLLKNTHRRGNLIVLLAPDVPAVLLELGFLSNLEDEKNLHSAAWRRKAMTAVAGAIDDYFERSRGRRRADAGGRLGSATEAR